MEKATALDLYYQMVLIRRVEEAAAQLYQQGKIGGFLHLYIGQEAVSTGLISVRKPQDRVITAYRDHGVAHQLRHPRQRGDGRAARQSHRHARRARAARCTWPM